MTKSRGGSQSFYHMFFRSLAFIQLHTRHQTYCYIGGLIASHHRLRTKAGTAAESQKTSLKSVGAKITPICKDKEKLPFL